MEGRNTGPTAEPYFKDQLTESSHTYYTTLLWVSLCSGWDTWTEYQCPKNNLIDWKEHKRKKVFRTGCPGGQHFRMPLFFWSGSPSLQCLAHSQSTAICSVYNAERYITSNSASGGMSRYCSDQGPINILVAKRESKWQSLQKRSFC